MSIQEMVWQRALCKLVSGPSNVSNLCMRRSLMRSTPVVLIAASGRIESCVQEKRRINAPVTSCLEQVLIQPALQVSNGRSASILW